MAHLRSYHDPYQRRGESTGSQLNHQECEDTKAANTFGPIARWFQHHEVTQATPPAPYISNSLPLTNLDERTGLNTAYNAGHPPEAGLLQQRTDSHAFEAPELYESYGNLLTVAKPSIFYPIWEDAVRKKPKKTVLNVATMQAVALRGYQNDLREAAKGMLDGKIDAGMPELLHRYCDALRNLDYVEDKARKDFDQDPFLLMSSRQMERNMMMNSGIMSQLELPQPVPLALDRARPALPGVGRTVRLHKEPARTRLISLLCALLGVLALVVPMIIMRLVPGTVCSLVTTTAFVLAFAVAGALLSNLKPGEILGVTAAYAAVLVVFVGTTS